ncbi:ATP-binding protein [Actinomadura sp. ATCC 31491]|uniref:ATP-binding protein n=1 Tax=Actinomadura luzonensis TaxID=2805427 RepID=A0ABT0FMX8_9ACTN|nr:ATP-binding protein [Actinomadura luzonensis]MCK2213636.1 ATP-binding protein [Actinomadura luzonensis]
MEHTFLAGIADPLLFPSMARDTVCRWIGARAHDLETVTSELVTNAVRHGLGPMPDAGYVRLKLTTESRRCELLVTDPGRSPGEPAMGLPDNDPSPDPDPDPGVERLRGLVLVDLLTGGLWGHFRNERRERVVWAVLPLA